MQVVMVYSEAGGVSKTTTAVGLAMAIATGGKKVVLVDLDPRASSSQWLGIDPVGKGLHVGAILASEEDTQGFAQDLAVQSTWSPNLRVIPSGRSLSNREADRSDHAELRLARSFVDLDADVVIIDCPNRQGGLLIQSAMTAADTVVYAATANEDGINGFLGAQMSVRKFIDARRTIGAEVKLKEAGVIVMGAEEIMSRVKAMSIIDFEDTGLLLFPIVPERTIVPMMKRTHEWYGEYKKGDVVVDAYKQLAQKVIR
jgi:chromosome partitioning protein